MSINLTKKNENGSFTIDLKKDHACTKGVYLIKVYPANPLDTLILDDNKSDLISYKNPFEIKSPLPMVNGRLIFKPFNSDDNMKSIVIMLLA